jgi:hypothetical protein
MCKHIAEKIGFRDVKKGNFWQTNGVLKEVYCKKSEELGLKVLKTRIRKVQTGLAKRLSRGGLIHQFLIEKGAKPSEKLIKMAKKCNCPQEGIEMLQAAFKSASNS